MNAPTRTEKEYVALQLWALCQAVRHGAVDGDGIWRRIVEALDYLPGPPLSGVSLQELAR